MANHKSSLKRIKQNAKRAERNKSVRSRLRTRIHQFEQALASDDLVAAEAAYQVAESELHRAASKGVIPTSRAARKTSRLALSLNKARGAATSA